MARELAAVQRMARQTGASLDSGLGGHGGGRSGAMRETLVLMRKSRAQLDARAGQSFYFAGAVERP